MYHLYGSTFSILVHASLLPAVAPGPMPQSFLQLPSTPGAGQVLGINTLTFPQEQHPIDDWQDSVAKEPISLALLMR